MKYNFTEAYIKHREMEKRLNVILSHRVTKKKLVEGLSIIRDFQSHNHSDYENDHVDADDLLLKYINDNEVTDLFNSIFKWYA